MSAQAAKRTRRTAARTVPLKDITISWPHRGPWDAEPKPMTITGEQLARVLDVLYLKLTSPDYQATVDLVSYRLEGLSALVDCDRFADESDAACSALRGILRDMAFEIRGADDRFVKQALEGATVTIGATSAGAAR
jgi:hypothetical protein